MDNKAITLPRRLYADAAGNVVGDKDPKKKTLIGAAGATIGAQQAQLAGTTLEKIAVAVGPPANKAKKAAPENKSAGKEPEKPQAPEPATPPAEPGA